MDGAEGEEFEGVDRDGQLAVAHGRGLLAGFFDLRAVAAGLKTKFAGPGQFLNLDRHSEALRGLAADAALKPPVVRKIIGCVVQKANAPRAIGIARGRRDQPRDMAARPRHFVFQRAGGLAKDRAGIECLGELLQVIIRLEDLEPGPPRRCFHCNRPGDGCRCRADRR